MPVAPKYRHNLNINISLETQVFIFDHGVVLSCGENGAGQRS